MLPHAWIKRPRVGTKEHLPSKRLSKAAYGHRVDAHSSACTHVPFQSCEQIPHQRSNHRSAGWFSKSMYTSGIRTGAEAGCSTRNFERTLDVQGFWGVSTLRSRSAKRWGALAMITGAVQTERSQFFEEAQDAVRQYVLPELKVSHLALLRRTSRFVRARA